MTKYYNGYTRSYWKFNMGVELGVEVKRMIGWKLGGCWEMILGFVVDWYRKFYYGKVFVILNIDSV